ncbi:MAG: ATP-dependent helicase UvrD/PcrA [Actinomycetota bacterium]|nr:ATP-dependent helicase UvrD/PcrA [Actinomycetota bacterium]
MLLCRNGQPSASPERVSEPTGTVGGVTDRLLDDLDAHQRAAVTETHLPLAILAPAGSGKTRVLTRRIAWRVREELADARHVLAVTFTRRAAGELVDRIDALGVDAAVTAGTFHALALAQLRRRAAENRRELPRILDRKARVLAPLLRASGPQGTPAVADVATEIEWAKARMIPPEQYAAAARAAERRLPRAPAELADLYSRYEAEKRKRRWLDFDDLLGWCADAIERDDDFAAAQRWRFRHLFVDEFQDATPLQLRLLRAWLGDRPDLCVVGDGAQAIYAFAGADASPLVDFARHFPGGRTVALTYNYRSTDAIVAVAEAALGPASGVERDAPRAVRPADRRAVIDAFDDDVAEADAVADACWKEFTGGVPWHRIGVLFRTNAQSSLFEAALTRRGVPFRVTGAARFAARPAVRVLLDRLREADRSAPGRPFTEHLGDLAADVDEEPDVDDPSAGVPTPQPNGTASDEELRTHRDALLRFGREYLAVEHGPGSVAGFVSWLDLATRGESSDERGVDLVTFHRAKGLEWQVVFVTGLERGLVPISWATSPSARAEERRLLHVALGRAEDWMHCSWARERTAYGRRVTRQPTPWLKELERAAGSTRFEPVDPKERLGHAIATLRGTTPPAPTSHARRIRR